MGNRRIARRFIAGMLHMTNIHELHFENSFVDEEHWNAIATLPSLKKLTFILCRSFQRPANVEPEKRMRIRVPHLQVLRCCDRFRQPLAAIDAQCLRVLDIDFTHIDQVDWHLLSSLTELRFHIDPSLYGVFLGSKKPFMERLHAFLVQAPQSLELLRLAVDDVGVAQAAHQNIFDDPAWRNLAHLRSLTLLVESWSRDVLLDVSQTLIKYINVN